MTIGNDSPSSSSSNSTGLVLPLVLGIGSAAFIVVPLFTVVACCFFSDATLSYSLNQSAKEVLYTVTDAATKYQAKAFIDMFLMRLAKGIGSLFILAWVAWLLPLGWQTQHLGWLSIAIVVVWLVVARPAGRGFAERTKTGRAEGETAKSEVHGTAPDVNGRRIDSYVPSPKEARTF